MPTYDYKCDKCGVFEHVQKITEEPMKHCPHCGGKVKRLISGAGIIFKGSGFHVTDYKKEKKTEAPKETKSSPKASSHK